MKHRNSDGLIRTLERRVTADVNPASVLELAAAYKRAGMTAGRAETTVAIVSGNGGGMPRHLVFAHERGLSPDDVLSRMRSVIRSRFSSPTHREWLITHGNMTWVMGASAIPDADWSTQGLDLISKGVASLSIDADEIVVDAPTTTGERIGGSVHVDDGTGTLPDPVATFNAIDWFRQAEHDDLERLVRDEWTGVLNRDHASDAARIAAANSPAFALELAGAEASGRQVHIVIDDEAGERWIWDNAPRLARRLFPGGNR